MPFPEDAWELCATCGHQGDKHGDWYGCPEDGCTWNDADGDCTCQEFMPSGKYKYDAIKKK